MTGIPESFLLVALVAASLFLIPSDSLSYICTLILVLKTRKGGCFPCLKVHANLQYSYTTLGIPYFPFAKSGKVSFVVGTWMEVCSVHYLACLDLFKCTACLLP